MRKIKLFSAIILVGAFLGPGAEGSGLEGPAATRVELTLPGLKEPVEIITDRWGISHIYARTQPDLFFAQGFNVARDRLFQLEIWRRQATGTLAEVL